MFKKGIFNFSGTPIISLLLFLFVTSFFKITNIYITVTLAALMISVSVIAAYNVNSNREKSKTDLKTKLFVFSLFIVLTLFSAIKAYTIQ